jgi:hypothetical protein
MTDPMKPADSIDDPVAVDTWVYDAGGVKQRTRIEVGRPVRRDPKDPNSEWACQLRIEGETQGIETIYGLGPVDALMNAMQLVRRFFEKTHRHAPKTL